MIYGLIGKSLQHSFSRRYFQSKFAQAGLAHEYRNFELNSVGEFPSLLKNYRHWGGLNVTIPYKTSIMAYLDRIEPEAEAIGAVNTLVFEGDQVVGYNTDIIGIEASLQVLCPQQYAPAMVLGTGGAAQAVVYFLRQKQVPYCWVSREPKGEQTGYLEAGMLLKQYPLLINCTPVGTYPQIDERPPLALSELSAHHVVFDMIYNPSETALLREARLRGARGLNGELMLEQQAEAAWALWQKAQA